MTRRFLKGQRVILRETNSGIFEGCIGHVGEYYNDRYHEGDAYDKYFLFIPEDSKRNKKVRENIGRGVYLDEKYLTIYVTIDPNIRDVTPFITMGNSEELWKELVG